MAQIQVISITDKLLKYVRVSNSSMVQTTQYYYQLIPHHPTDKIQFFCSSESDLIYTDDTHLLFNIRVTLQVDNDIHKPTIVDLLTLVNMASAYVNDLLKKHESPHNVELVPFDPDETIPVLEACLLAAYPVN